ncbi:MAG: hypothetical protein K2I92_06885 [Muribaculaceae bacterium]|nr:hypothetical protein [Muribaculaceae bacterium]
MKYIKTLALLLLSISILTSCSEDEYFSTDVYSMKDTKAIENETKSSENDTNGFEPNDTTDSGKISILFDEPDVEDIDYAITIP